MQKKHKIFITGHNGMVGSAILKQFKDRKNIKLITISKNKLNLLNQTKVNKFFKLNSIETVIFCSAKVGGVYANMTKQNDFLYENSIMSLNTIFAAFNNNVKNFIFFGSSCMYPKNINKKITEKDLLSSSLEKTNEGYALAKITGFKMCEYIRKKYKRNYFTIIPTNLYGENDNFNLKNSHVVPAVIKKIHDAKINSLPEVKFWGTGRAIRDFMLVDDLAKFTKYILENSKKKKLKSILDDNNGINFGTGMPTSIKSLILKVKKIVRYEGKILFDSNYPDGMMRKVLASEHEPYLKNITKITPLEKGLKKTYNWYLKNYKNLKNK